MNCVIKGCDRPIHNKTLGYCSAHYRRTWSKGDPLAHIPLPPPRAKSLPAVDHSDGTRTCQSCEKRLPLSSFHLDSRSPLGRRKSCRDCRVAVETVRYNVDPVGAAARIRAYRQAHLEQVRAREARDYEKNKEARIASAIANSHLRRARVLKQGWERGITVKALRKRDGDKCHYCSVDLVFGTYAAGERPPRMGTLEHKQAIARGGSHTWDNCVLACWRCNIAKGAKPLEDFMAGAA